jgi:uncharacterized radical SAM superfamily Fe-S cluster-containing enzyme
LVRARVFARDGKVVMAKECPDHGTFEVLVSSNASGYIESARFERPGKEPLVRLGKTELGCPNDCGLCPAHKQHTCVGVIEVTTDCDLACPVCFAAAGDGHPLPLETVRGMIDTLVECEGEPEILQLSGGEPTTHPDILEILRYAAESGVRYPMLNTNGLRLSDPDFARDVAAAVPGGGGPVGTPVVYLQFDGVTEGPYETLRDRPMLTEKLRAIENCREFGMSVVLVPTIVRGVNDHEVGALVEMALSDPIIKGVNFQPAARIGRFDIESDRMTIPEVLQAIEEGTEGIVGKDSFVPVPCPHPACSVCCYVYRDGERTLTLLDLVDTDMFMAYMADQAVPFGQVVSETLESAASALSLEDLAGQVLFEGLSCCPGGIRVPEVRELIDRVTLITVHAFMDEMDFDLDRARKCCVTEVLPDGRMVPFCVYNTLHRDREDR